MNMRSMMSISVLAVFLGTSAAVPASAQSSPTPDKPRISEHHQRQFEMMKDMSRGMSEMSEQMAHGELAPD